MIPLSKRPLDVLFLDLNAYFASVEQAENPELQGRPVGVAATMTPTGTLVAASYQAKRFGVKTGTRVDEAQRLCPEIAIVPTRHSLYVYTHDRIREAVETVLPIDKVHSIDEMSCKLLGDERRPDVAQGLARKIKAAIADLVSPVLTCSIGIAPNAFLAKLATEMQKPDGLVTLTEGELPGTLTTLKLTDFTGINRRMKARLEAHGIFTAEQLVQASPERLREAFGSVIGERWWYLMRGCTLEEKESPTKSLGHSYVLPPKLRTDSASREVMLRLAHKATARLRAASWMSGHLSLGVRGYARSWKAETHLEPTQDTVEVTRRLLELWEGRDFAQPYLVSVTFTQLQRPAEVTPSLFAEPVRDTNQLSRAVDAVNRKFGKHTVFLAALSNARDAASEKIAFQKTSLFSEGQGDHEWTSPFRGPTKRQPPV